MLSIKRIRENLADVKTRLGLRCGDYPLDEVVELDEKRRKLITEAEELKAELNKASKQIPELKKKGEDTTALMADLKKLSDAASKNDAEIKDLDLRIQNTLLEIPNTPKADTPVGASDADNVEIRKVGTPRNFDFEPKAHWDIGEGLDILDFERAGKLTGARFVIDKGLGAKLERAIINFMLDLHTEEHGFKEILPPFMVNRASMTGTGQLPKFEDDMFEIPSKDYFLVPTAEVPLTNMFRDEILKASDLPCYLTAYTPCFRKEAGSAGRDTRGIIRQHQFNKVELVKFVRPESSYDELESLTAAAEEVLKRLELPYRVIRLCGGDLGFSSAMTYDIEVFMPSYGRYLEISSCSNFEDYQAIRANIRFRDDDGKVKFVHTLNGSGLAVGRTLAAVLENYQNEDGSVTVPNALVPYMRGVEVITKG